MYQLYTYPFWWQDVEKGVRQMNIYFKSVYTLLRQDAKKMVQYVYICTYI